MDGWVGRSEEDRKRANSMVSAVRRARQTEEPHEPTLQQEVAQVRKKKEVRFGEVERHNEVEMVMEGMKSTIINTSQLCDQLK